MKVYELTVLIHPDLEMNLEPALKKLEKTISDSGGKIIKTTDDGKKRLTYPIKGNEYAIFNYIDVELPADAPRKISNALNIADEVIRYLLVVKDERKAKLEAKRREAEEQGEVSEEDSEEKSELKDSEEKSSEGVDNSNKEE